VAVERECLCGMWGWKRAAQDAAASLLVIRPLLCSPLAAAVLPQESHTAHGQSASGGHTLLGLLRHSWQSSWLQAENLHRVQTHRGTNAVSSSALRQLLSAEITA
jgi:hypothetical protein